MSLWSRIRNVLGGDRLSREIDEEFQSHIEEAIATGRDPAEARRAFGSALSMREESRDIRLVAWLDSLRADAVFGWRQLMKRKVTSATAILSLALANRGPRGGDGIGSIHRGTALSGESDRPGHAGASVGCYSGGGVAGRAASRVSRRADRPGDDAARRIKEGLGDNCLLTFYRKGPARVPAPHTWFTSALEVLESGVAVGAVLQGQVAALVVQV